MTLIILSILGIVAVFLIFSFIYWSINPANWDFEARILCGFLFAIVIVLSFIAHIQLY